MAKRIPFYKSGYTPSGSDNSTFIPRVFKTPMSIYRYFDRFVYGHDEYKRKLSMVVWNAYRRKRPKGGLLVIGNSGEGKTELIRTLQTFYKNSCILDGSICTPQGYRGNNKITTGLAQLDTNSCGPLPICIVDEFDKMVLKSQKDYGDSSLFELLKILEGGKIDVTENSNQQPCIIDTSEICFILLGAFTYLKEDRKANPIGFGSSSTADNTPVLNEKNVLEQLPPEVRGRIESVVLLEPFTEEDYLSILTSSRYSPARRIAKDLGVRISLSKEMCEQLAHEAFTEHVGIRIINSKISEACNNILFEDPDCQNIILGGDHNESEL